MTTAKKIALSLTGALSIALGTGYFLGLAYFQTHFKIGTTINGFKCSLKTVDETEALLSRGAESYAMAVNTRNNGVEKISANDVGMVFTGRSDLIDIINEQNYKLWFVPVMDDINLPIDCYQIDNELMTEQLGQLKCMNDMVKGESAHVVETNGIYQVSPSVKGTELDKEKTNKLIETAIRQWKPSVDLEESGCYIDADIIDEEKLRANCDLLNSIQDTIITYDFGDRKETVDINVITDNFLNKNYGISINKIKDYLSSIAAKYDTIGVQREFVTYDDKKIPISGGDYGWRMDVDKTADDLVKLIKAKTVDVVSPKYIQEAVSRNLNDIGRSYLEIDTSKERAVLYVDGDPIIQTTAHLGTGLAPGFFSIKGKTDDNKVLFGNGCIYTYNELTESGFSGTEDISGIASNGIEPGCIAIEEIEMLGIFGNIQETWPIIIY